MDSTTNELNRVAFARELPSLRSKFPSGYYVLFVGAALVGAYATYSDALAHGYDKAGKAPFFVKQINTASDEDIQCVLSPFTASWLPMLYGLTKGLPIVPVRIGISLPYRQYLTRSLERCPNDQIVYALIDTGATLTVIDSSIVAKLCIPDRGYCTVRGFDGNLHAAPEAKMYLNYDVSLAILSSGSDSQEVVVSNALQVVGADLGHKDFQMLLGLDVLRQCTLFMDLSGGHFDVAPSSPYPKEL
jgi:hypothetical protein